MIIRTADYLEGDIDFQKKLAKLDKPEGSIVIELAVSATIWEEFMEFLRTKNITVKSGDK